MADQSQTQRQVFSGRYELHRQIGRGGMADVWLSRDQLLDRPVALKVLFREFSTDPSFVERFRREAQSAANLSHPNIVGVYDWGEEDGTYFIVMEYIKGRSLADILRAEGALRPDISADIAIDVASALSFAHQSGVIHRDIKPGNILVSPNGQVKVTDFGIARAFNGGVDNDLTQAGNVMGTATYFSPEQAQGLPMDPRSDVYSLGVVLYEMLTGGPPFTGDNPLAIAYKHVQDTPVMPSVRNPKVPRTIEAITMKALSKDVSTRYPSAPDVIADLARFRKGDVVGQRRAEVHPTMSPSGPFTGADDPTIAVPMAVARESITSSQPAVSSTGMQTIYVATDPEPRHRNTTLFVTVAALLLAVLAVLGVLLYNQVNKSSGDVVKIGKYTGLTIEAARAQIEANGLQVETLSAIVDPTVPAGQVLTQFPAEGASLKRNGIVKLTPSAGATGVKVPKLVGLSVDQAKAVLDSNGLLMEQRPASDPTKPKNEIISQQPAEGEQIGAGKSVVVVVSTGKGDVLVRDVKGMTIQDALVALTKDGLSPVSVQKPDPTAKIGDILGTNPAAGQKVPADSKIEIWVSSGPQQVTVENVIGKSQIDATNILKAQTLHVTIASTVLPAGDSRVNLVISQSRNGGDKVNPGSDIILTIGVAPATTTTSSTTTTTTSTSSSTSSTSTSTTTTVAP